MSRATAPKHPAAAEPASDRSTGFQVVSENLPEEWSMTTLAKLTEKGGMCSDGDWVESVDQDSNGDVRLIQLADIGEGVFRDRSNRFMTSAKAAELGCTFLEEGDLLIARMADPIGRACIFPGDTKRCVTVVDVCVFRPPQNTVETKWLTTIFNNSDMRQRLLDLASGTTRARISRSKLIQIPFPIPPLVEQGRIAARLEALEARSRRARAKLAEVPAQLAQARQSLLAAAFRGDLTADWRSKNKPQKTGNALLADARTAHRCYAENQKNGKWFGPQKVDPLPTIVLPNTWAWSAGSEVVDPGADIVYGIVQPGPKLEKGVPYVRGTDIQDGKILLNQLLNTSADIAKRYARSSLITGDVLLGIIRATKVAVVPAELNGGNITQGTARFRPSPVISTSYLARVLETPDTQSWLHGHYRGIDMPGLNLADVRRVPIPLPPLPEQHEIVRRLSAAFARLDAAVSAHAAAMAALDRLDQSLLARAISGRLLSSA